MGDDTGAWKTLRSRTLVDDRWLRLRADACETPSGEVLDPYYVVECRDWVAVVAITTDDDLVLVQQYRHPVGRVTLELPAGEVDAGEDAITAARRELWEETGYTGGAASLVRTAAPNTARYANTLHIILIRGVTSGPPPPSQPGGEATLPALCPVSDAAALLLRPDFENAHHIGALAVALFSGGEQS